MAIFRIIGASARLRCPRCGRGRLFSGLFRMRPRCAHCGMEFEPEQGFYVGAIYLNYAATVAIAMPGYFLLDYFTGATIGQQIVLWGAFAILFPLLFFRHSRSLWLGLMCLMSSNSGEETSRSRDQRGGVK